MDIVTLIVTAAFSHPEFVKELFFFFLAWFLLKKGIEKNFSKMTNAIERLTQAMQKLEENHSTRLTVLEVKVDKLSQQKE